MSPVLYAIVPVAITIGVAVAFLLWLKRRVAECRVELDAIGAGRPRLLLDGRANCFGRESLGKFQARGNGLLALFGDEIVFVQWLPKRSFRIRLEHVITADETWGFLGKTVARPLLRVAWREQGKRDIAVWWVDDLPAWRAAIEQAQQKNSAVVSKT